MNPKPTILAVDDTPVNLELLDALLTPAGYLVRPASSGEMALAAVATDPPDLILLDMRMPGLDGLEVCRQLQAQEQTATIPIIFLSGVANIEEKVAGLQRGAVDFITKPFQREELLARVSTHLALRRANLSLELKADTLAQANKLLQAESLKRHDAEAETRLSLARAERSRRALLSALEDQKKSEEKLRRNESRLQGVVHILQYRATSRQEFLDHALAEVIRITESRFGYIYYYNEERQEFILNSWSKDVMAACAVANPQTCYALDKTGVWGEAVRQRKPMVINDFAAAHPLKKGYPEGHVPLTRFLTVPVINEEKIVAVVGVANKARDYDDVDTLQLTLLMNAVWKTLEIQESEEALRRYAEEMATILDILPAVVWIGLDPECKVILGNRAANELTGIAAGTNISQSAVASGHAVPLTPLKKDGSLFLPEELPMQRAVALAQPVQDTELHLSFADGRQVDLFGSAAPLFDGEGKVRGSVAAFTNISEHKRTEVRLRKLNRTYALLSSLSQAIVRVHEPEALFAAACRIAVEQGGFRLAWVARLDVPSGAVQAVICAGINDGYLEKLAIRLDDPDRNHGPTAIALLEGRRVVVNDIASDARMGPWRDDALQRGYRSAIFLPLLVAGAVYGSLNLYAPEADFFDDTEVELLAELAATLSFALEFSEREQQRREVEKKLWESEEIFRHFMEHSPVYVFFKDEQMRSMRLSDNFSEMLGKPLGDLLGKNMEELFPSDLARKMVADDLKVLREGAVVTVEEEFNGRRYSTIKFPIVIEGKPRYLAGFTLDITERRAAEEEIRTLNATLEERVRQRTDELLTTNRELETFSYSVSHDLRAPLRAIDGFSKILLDEYGPNLDDEGQRICNVISANTRRMGELIDALLAFSRLGRMELKTVAVNMTDQAQAAFDELTTPEMRRRIDFSLAALPRTTGDPVLMRQIWVNLLSNAIKFSDRAERAVIDVSASRQGDEIVYTVRDNGAGFNMAYANKLFGVFQRLHSDKEFAGTGLGLALVRRIVERHGGRIWAEGEPGQGATFYFTLGAARKEGSAVA